MNAQHTPGPWDIVWGPTIEIADGVASVPQRLDGRHTANAHLIATAPVMLETLQEAERVLAEKLRRLGAEPEQSPTYRRIVAAIAKATGSAS